MISSPSLRGAAMGALGAGAVAAALMFAGAPAAQATPGPSHSTSFASVGPQGGPGFIPDRPGGGHGWGGHDGRGNGNWGNGNWGNNGWGHGGWGQGSGYWGHPQHWVNWWW